MLNKYHKNDNQETKLCKAKVKGCQFESSNNDSGSHMMFDAIDAAAVRELELEKNHGGSFNKGISSSKEKLLNRLYTKGAIAYNAEKLKEITGMEPVDPKTIKRISPRLAAKQAAIEAAYALPPVEAEVSDELLINKKSFRSDNIIPYRYKIHKGEESGQVFAIPLPTVISKHKNVDEQWPQHESVFGQRVMIEGKQYQILEEENHNIELREIGE